MKFDHRMLETIEYIVLSLADCEEFEIDGGDIVDFQTDIRTDARGDKYADDGSLVISKNALGNLMSAASRQYADGTIELDHAPREVFELGNYLLDRCDICRVYVRFKDGEDVLFCVPYDPIGSDLTGEEAELSNCPSAELDENGDLLVLFGASSRAYRRTDNNYADLIIGLQGEFGASDGAPAQVSVTEFSNKESDLRCPRLFIGLQGESGGAFRLVFEDVQDVVCDISFQEGKRSLWMARLSTGEIFTEIEGLCSFLCRAVKTYDVYLGEEDDPERYEEGEIYTRALHCRLDEREMKLFADNHIAKTEKGFDVALFESALQKVLDGEISVPYFGNWLRAHSEMLQYYRGTRKMREFYVLLATMMDSLQIRLSYDKDLTACREMLISAADEILSLFRHYLA